MHPGPTSGGSTHLGWTFSSPPEFESRVTTYLAEGLARHEKVMYVVDDPRRGQWPGELVDRGDLVIASITEIYGDERIVVAKQQRATFEEVLADALDEGYTGIRVAADNTSLIDGAERLEAWLEWEEMCEVFLAENPITGLCAFDVPRADPDSLRRTMDLHHASLPD